MSKCPAWFIFIVNFPISNNFLPPLCVSITQVVGDSKYFICQQTYFNFFPFASIFPSVKWNIFLSQVLNLTICWFSSDNKFCLICRWRGWHTKYWVLDLILEYLWISLLELLKHLIIYCGASIPFFLDESHKKSCDSQDAGWNESKVGALEDS